MIEPQLTEYDLALMRTHAAQCRAGFVEPGPPENPYERGPITPVEREQPGVNWSWWWQAIGVVFLAGAVAQGLVDWLVGQ